VSQQTDLTYANAHQFGQGPNWRIRLSRVALAKLGLDPELLKHGIVREIYAMPLASNAREFLSGRDDVPLLDRPTVQEIGSAALNRWIVPRATRCPEFAAFQRNDLLDEFR
jgi:hypothetical protein